MRSKNSTFEKKKTPQTKTKSSVCTTTVTTNGQKSSSNVNGGSSVTSITSDTTSISSEEYCDNLKIINHLKSIEKINEKRRVFLTNTISEYSSDEKNESEIKNSLNGHNGSSSSNGKVIDAIKTTTPISVDNLNIEEKRFQRMRATAESFESSSDQEFTFASPPYTTPLKSPSSPPPKPPMLSRNRSIGNSSDRASLQTPPQSPVFQVPATAADMELPRSAVFQGPLLSSAQTEQSSEVSQIVAADAAQIDSTPTVQSVNVLTVSSTVDEPVIAATVELTETAVLRKVQRPQSLAPAVPREISERHYERMVEELKCPGCASPMKGPVLLCESGHSICSQCTRVLLMCPLCKAHRVVLAACSDYFCAMFTDAMREASQSEIKLNGVTARGIELLIEYAYTSKLELDRNNIQDMLSVSSHVQMKAVIDACSNYLDSQIDLENCVAIAALADLYSLDALKRKTYRYICSRFDEFAQTPDLLNLSWDQLEYILTCNYPVDCTEERVLQITTQYCIETAIKPELARRLFARVRFNQIDPCALNAITCPSVKVDTTVGTEHSLEVAYCQVLCTEIHKQQQKQNSSHDVGQDSSGMEESNVLTNSRGMELALVKIGGFETNGLTNQLSCYLPSKGKWENLTVIPHIEQCNYGTAVLGNDLYIVGGSYDVCLKEYIHPFGFRYCSTKNKWRTIAPIQADRCRFSLNAMGTNFLYAVGGVCELNESDGVGEHWAHDIAISNCERYNASSDLWEYLPALSENRSQHAGVVLGDKLFISGGIDRQLVFASLWCFDTNCEKWNQLRPMPTPRADHVLIAFENRIYACGGWYEDPATETRVLADTIDVYDIKTDEWTTETRNPMPKFYTGVAAVKRKIYFIGGLLSTETINRASSSVQCYDLDTKQWSFNSEWEYPKEVWECTCAAFYVPRERDDVNDYWGQIERTTSGIRLPICI